MRARGGEVARAHAVDLVREFAQARGEARARHEVQQLEREEERHHQHHHDVEQHLEQHVVDERGVDADVQHAERLVGVVIGIETMYCVPDARRLRQRRRRLVRDLRAPRGGGSACARPIGLLAARVEHVARRCR